jgi:glycerol-3-phosphate dehydrogenase (NAD(P)+)
MARARGIEMPIAAAVAAVIDKSSTVDEAIDSLLTRPLRAEE